MGSAGKSKEKKLLWLVYVSGFLDLLGVAMIYPLLTRYAKDLGASPSQIGLFGSLYGTIQLFTSPLMGQLSDKFGRRQLILISLIGTAASYCAIGFSNSILMLIFARIPAGIFKHSQAMSKIYIVDITSPAERASAFGMFNAMSSLGFIIGPAVGGTIAMWDDGIRKAAVLASIVFFMNLVFVWCLIPEPEKKRADDVKKKRTSQFSPWVIVSGFQNLRNVNWMQFWDVFLIGFLLSFSMLVFRSNFTNVLTYRFGTDSQINGYILSLNGILAAIAGACMKFIVPWFSSNQKMHNFFAVMMAASLGMITMAPSLMWVLISLVPLCVASSVLRVTNASALHERSDEKSRGLVSGTGATLTSLARAIGPSVAGFAQEISIYGPGFSGTSIAIVGSAIGFFVQGDNLHSHQD